MVLEKIDEKDVTDRQRMERKKERQKLIMVLEKTEEREKVEDRWRW
jgi:hypothetical protein